MPNRPQKKVNGSQPPPDEKTFENREEYFKALFNTALVATVNMGDFKKYLKRYNVSTTEIKNEVENHLHNCGFPEGEIQTAVDEENQTLSWFVPIALEGLNKSPESNIIT